MSAKVPESMQKYYEKRKKKNYTADEVYHMNDTQRRILGIEFDDAAYEAALAEERKRAEDEEIRRRFEQLSPKKMMEAITGVTPMLPYAKNDDILSSMQSAMNRHNTKVRAGDIAGAESERKAFVWYATLYGNKIGDAEKAQEYNSDIDLYLNGMRESELLEEARGMSREELEYANERGYFEAKIN